MLHIQVATFGSFDYPVYRSIVTYSATFYIFRCLLPEEEALVLVQTVRIRQATGEDLTQQTLLVVALSHVAAIEFADIKPLEAFGISPPPTGR